MVSALGDRTRNPGYGRVKFYNTIAQIYQDSLKFFSIVRFLKSPSKVEGLFIIRPENLPVFLSLIHHNLRRPSAKGLFFKFH